MYIGHYDVYLSQIYEIMKAIQKYQLQKQLRLKYV